MPKPLDRLKESMKKVKEQIESEFDKISGKTKGAKEPRYWGSWKGRVARAIAEYGPLTWGQLRDITGLSRETLNHVLAEMYEAKTIEKRENDTYWLEYKLFKEYQEFLGISSQEAAQEKLIDKPKVPKASFEESKQDDLVMWIESWVSDENLEFAPDTKHFFLSGHHLDELSRKLILKASNEIMIVNPYIQKCALSDTLRKAAEKGKEVLLITKTPDMKSYNYEEKQQYHNSLFKTPMKVIVNDTVHAKLLVVDRCIAIVSSMNFYAASTSGKSWEAGLVTVDGVVVANVMNAILNLKSDYESQEKSGFA
ncbi:MAG: phospholipase D-like domain-containing protein [Promethearchaeota archaeon]